MIVFILGIVALACVVSVFFHAVRLMDSPNTDPNSSEEEMW